MELDVTQAVLLKAGAGRKLEWPELMVIETARDPEDPGVAPHVHLRHADAFYVLEGEVDFFLAGETVHASADWFVLSPPGVVHGIGPGPSRLLNFHAPGAPYAAEGRDSYDPPEDGGKGEAVVVPAGEGERLAGKERVAVVKASLPELTLSEFQLSPRFEGPEPHRHDDHVDSFYVLEGEVDFLFGDETVRGTPGTFFAAPPGIEHTFTNPGPAGARLLNMHSPDGGFLEFLRQQS